MRLYAGVLALWLYFGLIVPWLRGSSLNFLQIVSLGCSVVPSVSARDSVCFHVRLSAGPWARVVDLFLI